MTTKLNSVDVLIIGLGWTGGIIAKELADSGLKIVALERGGPRDTNPDFLDPQIHDELRYAARHDLMQNVRRETLTFRNELSQTALRCANSALFCRDTELAVPACTGTA